MVVTGTNAEHYAGLDIGTTSISCAVIEAAAGRVLGAWSRPHGAELPPAQVGEYLQDPQRLLEGARAWLEEVQSRYGLLRGLGVTGQMHGILYLDGSGKAASPLYTWLDGRASQTGPDGLPYLRALEERTGRKVAVGYGAATHFTNLQAAAIPPEARGLCGIPEYVAMHLAGVGAPVTDPSLAHGLGLDDPQGAGFDREAWARLGEPVLALPEVAETGRVLGLYAGSIPVCTPLGDNQASFLGSVQEPERAALINVGTSGQVSCLDALLGDPVEAPSSLERRPYRGGRSLWVGASLTGGKALERLASLLAEIVQAAGGTLDDPYRLINAVPPSIPDPPLRVDTRFAGSRADPGARGSIASITLQNFTLGHLVHGFCQGIVDELYDLWIRAKAGQDTRLEYLVGSGNAVRANRLLRQYLAATFERPIRIPAYREEAAVGAAVHAAAIVRGEPADSLVRRVVIYGTDEKSGWAARRPDEQGGPLE